LNQHKGSKKVSKNMDKSTPVRSVEASMGALAFSPPPGNLARGDTPPSSSSVSIPNTTNNTATTSISQQRTKRSSIYDRIRNPPRQSVSLSLFSFLFSELVQYNQNKIKNIGDFERRLEEAGYGVGQRVIEHIAVRDKMMRRETRVVNMLQYIHNTVWKFLFNKNADGLERSVDNEDEYMIYDNDALTNKFVSLPQDIGQLNCAAYLAGLISGILDSAKFNARVTAHLLDDDNGIKTVFLIKFNKEVMERETKLG
jgi:trafficking protein particle complex subunit 5